MSYGQEPTSKRSSRQAAGKRPSKKTRPPAHGRRLNVESLEPRLPLSGVPQFSGMVLFGDSLTDTGNVPAIVSRLDGYKQTDGCYTSPLGTRAPYQVPVEWHEELAMRLGIPAATPAKQGGSNWATGGATTAGGYGVGPLMNLTNYPYGYPNVGQQVADYFAKSATCPSTALFAVWAGANDLFNVADAAKSGGRNGQPASV